MITVWEFRSIDGKEVVVSVRPMRDDDTQYQNEYQRILYRGVSDGWVNRKIGRES